MSARLLKAIHDKMTEISKGTEESPDTASCYYCGTPVPTGAAHREHVFPKSHGGPYNRTNIVLSCPSCNFAKNAKFPLDWILSASGPKEMSANNQIDIVARLILVARRLYRSITHHGARLRVRLWLINPGSLFSGKGSCKPDLSCTASMGECIRTDEKCPHCHTPLWVEWDMRSLSRALLLCPGCHDGFWWCDVEIAGAERLLAAPSRTHFQTACRNMGTLSP